MKDRAASIILNPLILRIAWQVAPSVVICGLFWLAALRGAIPSVRGAHLPWSRRLGWISVAGIAMNALVTIANGGYMPVVGDITSLSLWVSSTDAHTLLWLADYESWWGFSLGDGFIIGGWLARLVYWSGRRLSAARRDDHSRMAECSTRRARLAVILPRDSAGWRP